MDQLHVISSTPLSDYHMVLKKSKTSRLQDGRITSSFFMRNTTYPPYHSTMGAMTPLVDGFSVVPSLAKLPYGICINHKNLPGSYKLATAQVPCTLSVLLRQDPVDAAA
jgi:hypothetical protein